MCTSTPIIIYCTGTPQLPTNLVLTSNSSTIVVSWTGPSYTPDSYNIFYYCQHLCDSKIDVVTTTGINVSTTSQATVAPGTSCTVNVTAMFGSFISSSINTLSEGSTIDQNVTTMFFSVAPTSAPEGLTNTSVESRSLTVQWGTVPCPDQRGPITDTDCATAMATLQERGADSMC